MTREEAIEILNNVSFFAPSEINVDKALDMAISALSKVDNAENPKCDLISRADAIEAACKAVCEDDVSIFPECDQIKYCDEIQALLALPSADAVQGEWIRVGHDIYECSLCHQNVMTKDIDCYSYCHRCGARMKGGAV